MLELAPGALISFSKTRGGRGAYLKGGAYFVYQFLVKNKRRASHDSCTKSC